uniref:Uncharacterized protein n=1 Tax=Magallana gigas TaxID=29159 RepID=A0A8W8N040_MAGGI
MVQDQMSASNCYTEGAARDLIARMCVRLALQQQDNGFPRFQPQPCFSQPILPSPTYTQGERNKKPANYDGKTSWSDYLIQFEIIAELDKWDSLTKAYELATSLKGKPYSVQNAVTLALECEAFQNGRKQRSNLKYNRSMNEVQYDSSLLKSLDSVSRNPERVPQRPRENMNQIQRKADTTGQVPAKISPKRPDTGLPGVSRKPDASFVKATVFGIDVDCLVDTGSTANILHADKYLEIHESQNKSVQLTQRAVLQIGQIPIQNKESLRSAPTCRIRVSENIALPPYSETVIKGNIVGETTMTECVLEPCSAKLAQKGVVIARSLVDIQQKYVSLRVGNFTNETVTVHKGTFAAVVEEIDHIETRDLKSESVCQIDQRATEVSDLNSNIPEHLADLLFSSDSVLNEES